MATSPRNVETTGTNQGEHWRRAAAHDKKSIFVFCSTILCVILVVWLILHRINQLDSTNNNHNSYTPKYSGNGPSTPIQEVESTNQPQEPITPLITDDITEKQENFSCNSMECVTATEQLKLSMNESVDPCEDFYKYACQDWINSNIPPKGENSTEPFMQRYLKNIESVQSLIENITDENTITEIKANNFYISCTDTIKENVTWTLFDDKIEKARQNLSGTRSNSNYFLFRLEKYAQGFRLDDDGPVNEPTITTKLCLHFTEIFFPELISRLFVQKYLLPEDVESVKSLVTTIRSTYLSTISSSLFPWMDNSSKIRLHGRIKQLPIVIGYTERIMDTNWVAGIYRNVNVSSNSDDFFENFLTLSYTRANFTNYSIHDDATTKSSAHYAFMNNEIFIPAGTIQFPLFHHTYPNVLKFARLGTSIAHELTHALVTHIEGFNKINTFILDSMRIKYPKSVATLQTRRNYKARSSCVAAQYSNFSVPLLSSNFKLMVNGTFTLNENVADIIGIQIAFKGFMENYGQLQTSLFPGMDNFTNEQIFFISTAQKFCQSFTNSTVEINLLKEQVANDVHSPGSVRVFGTLRNFDEFSNAFKCPLGSRYNPEKKCSFLKR